jgi:hypothetical protein
MDVICDPERAQARNASDAAIVPVFPLSLVNVAVPVWQFVCHHTVAEWHAGTVSCVKALYQ